MTKFLEILAFALLVPIGLTSALAAQTNPENPKFSLTITADKPEVTLGADIVIGIKITNLSEKPLTFTFGHHGGMPDGYQYDVRDEQGAAVAKVVHKNPLYPTKLPGSSIMGGGVIQPGKSIGEGAQISEVYQFGHPGKYSIQVSREVPWSPVIYSNIITVTVLPADRKPHAHK